MSFCNKLKFSNPYSFATWWCKPLIFQTKTIWSNRINSLKYERSRRMGCQVIGIRKSEFVANTHFLFCRIFLYLVDFHGWISGLNRVRQTLNFWTTFHFLKTLHNKFYQIFWTDLVEKVGQGLKMTGRARLKMGMKVWESWRWSNFGTRRNF